jgi:hypothetical protein
MANGGNDLISILERIDRERQSAAGKSAPTAAPTAGAVSMDPELQEAVEAGGDPWGVFGIDAELAGVQIGGTPDRTVGRAVAQFQIMTSEEIGDLQRRLYGGGFYPSTYYGTGRRAPSNFISEGVPDEVTYAAFQDALIRAARRKLAQQILGGLATQEMSRLEALRRQPGNLEEEPPELQG